MPVNLIEALTSKEAVAFYIAIAAVLVSAITFRYQRKQYRFSALVEVFKLLNDEKHRVARRVVYSFHKGREDCVGRLSLLDLGFTEETPKIHIIKEYQAIVRNDFNQIGSLITNNLLPEEAFMDTYWYTILRCWMALERDINEERNIRGHPGYMKNFEELSRSADRYRCKKHPTVHPNFNEICVEQNKKNS
jgi:hypothetical protein